MSTKKRKKPGSKPSRFQIRFENPAQKKAYLKMIRGINKVSDDQTLYGGSQISKKR